MKVLRTTWWLQAQLAVVVTVALLGVLAALTVSPSRAVGDDVLRLVGSAGTTVAEAGSYRMEMDLGVEGSGIEISLTGTAETDTATGATAGTLRLPGGKELSFVATGGRGYFELPEESALRLGGQEWVGFPLAVEQPVTEDPLLFLQLLSGDGQVREVGRDEVRGVGTTRYRTRVDEAALQALADEQSSTVLPPDALEAIADGTVDVWISDDGLPRRLRVTLEAEGLDVTFAFELFDYGADVRVTAPPAATVLDTESQQEAQEFLR